MTPTREVARQPAFDPNALGAMFGETPAVIGAVLETFCTSMAEHVQHLRAARAASDAAQLQVLAHRIKGAAHMSGARALAAGAEHLERVTRRGGHAGGIDAAALAVERQWAALQRDAAFRAAREGDHGT